MTRPIPDLAQTALSTNNVNLDGNCFIGPNPVPLAKGSVAFSNSANCDTGANTTLATSPFSFTPTASSALPSSSTVASNIAASTPPSPTPTWIYVIIALVVIVLVAAIAAAFCFRASRRRGRKYVDGPAITPPPTAMYHHPEAPFAPPVSAFATDSTVTVVAANGKPPPQAGVGTGTGMLFPPVERGPIVKAGSAPAHDVGGTMTSVRTLTAPPSYSVASSMPQTDSDAGSSGAVVQPIPLH
ncbi:hypothetical protein HK101_005330 [Irineochytrium annulatum]|nr:hypothetical protein HK101_005330 [Irineochytrium annulatum]